MLSQGAGSSTPVMKYGSAASSAGLMRVDADEEAGGPLLDLPKPPIWNCACFSATFVSDIALEAQTDSVLLIAQLGYGDAGRHYFTCVSTRIDSAESGHARIQLSSKFVSPTT